MPSSRARRAVSSDVGTPRTRSPSRTRAASARTNALAARPEPRPTTSPSLTRSRACVASAASGSLVVVAMRSGPRPSPRIPLRRTVRNRPDGRGGGRRRFDTTPRLVEIPLRRERFRESRPGARSSQCQEAMSHADDSAIDRASRRSGGGAADLADPRRPPARQRRRLTRRHSATRSIDGSHGESLLAVEVIPEDARAPRANRPSDAGGLRGSRSRPSGATSLGVCRSTTTSSSGRGTPESSRCGAPREQRSGPVRVRSAQESFRFISGYRHAEEIGGLEVHWISRMRSSVRAPPTDQADCSPILPGRNPLV